MHSEDEHKNQQLTGIAVLGSSNFIIIVRHVRTDFRSPRISYFLLASANMIDLAPWLLNSASGRWRHDISKARACSLSVHSLSELSVESTKPTHQHLLKVASLQVRIVVKTIRLS